MTIKFSKKRLFAIGLIAVFLYFAIGFVHKIARVPSGYKAKVTCSEVFVAGRQFDEVVTTNFDNISPTFDLVKLKINEGEKIVTGSFLSFGRIKAIYREGAGCTLDTGNAIAPVNIPVHDNAKYHSYKSNINAAVQKAMLSLFDDGQLPNPIMTRGVVVIQNNEVIAEHYADGFDKHTRQQSWSTAKGFIQALIGIAAKQGHLSVHDKAGLAVWQDEKDPRRVITIENLLQMASGLEYSEAYANPLSDVDQMLFNQHDMGAFSADKNLVETPGSVSRYSSGTTNILSNILRQKLETAGVDYHAFPKRELFDAISMNTAIFEVDGAGNFIGSSYIYATPRDFARFGQLYLQNGLWQGEQILPQNWVDYTRKPAPGSKGKYGSHWSLNIGQISLPGLPEDVIHLGGNDGQMIVVIPSKNAVIVRMGVTRYPATLEDDLYPLILKIYETL